MGQQQMRISLRQEGNARIRGMCKSASLAIEADQEVAIDESVEAEGAEEDARIVRGEEGDLHRGDNAGVEQERSCDAVADCRRNVVTGSSEIDCLFSFRISVRDQGESNKSRKRELQSECVCDLQFVNREDG